MQTSYRVVVMGCLVGLASACGADADVDIGDGKTGQRLSDYAATWVGYAEAYQFDDGSDQLRLVLDRDGNGRLEVGDSPRFPTSGPPHTRVGFDELATGFAYPIESAGIEASRLRLRVDPRAVFAQWCGEQVPIQFDEDDPERFSCIPNAASRGSNKGDAEICALELEPEVWTEIDCMIPKLCDHVCFCSAESCAVPPLDPEHDTFVELDGTLGPDGDLLEGTLLDGSERLAVRLERQ